MLPTLLAIAIVAANAPAVAPKAYRVDPARSSVGFDLDATAHTVRGSTGDVAGRIVATPADDGALALSGEIVVEAASLDTGNARRDRKMREESLATADHPRIVLRPERLAPTGPDSPAWELRGSLEVRGVSRPVATRVEIRPADGALLVTARFPVALADHGVPDPSFLFLRVAKSANAWAELVLVPSGVDAP